MRPQSLLPQWQTSSTKATLHNTATAYVPNTQMHESMGPFLFKPAQIVILKLMKHKGISLTECKTLTMNIYSTIGNNQKSDQRYHACLWIWRLLFTSCFSPVGL